MKSKAYFRIAFTGIFSVMLAYFSSATCISMYNTARKTAEAAESTGEINIDGADFSPFFILGGYIFGGILTAIEFIVCFIALTIFSLIAMLILRALLRKETSADELEYRISKYIVLGTAGLSVIITLIMTHFSGIIPVLVLTAVWVVFLGLVYVVRLRDLKNLKDTIPEHITAQNQ